MCSKKSKPHNPLPGQKHSHFTAMKTKHTLYGLKLKDFKTLRTKPDWQKKRRIQVFRENYGPYFKRGRNLNDVIIAVTFDGAGKPLKLACHRLILYRKADNTNGIKWLEFEDSDINFTPFPSPYKLRVASHINRIKRMKGKKNRRGFYYLEDKRGYGSDSVEDITYYVK